MENRVTALEKRVAQLASSITNANINIGSGADMSGLEGLSNRVDQLEAKLMQMWDEFGRWMKEIEDRLNQKADIAALNELEKLLQDRLNDIVKALTKQFADKAETKKALKLHERQLKNLYSLLMNKGEGGNEEDAMFSKKPLGGLSCASCEKYLVNMMGKKVEYMPWQKLPFRDPADRIARVG